MLSLGSTAQTILASDYKKIWWLFEIYDNASSSTTYYRATAPRTWNSNSYTFGVIANSFKGITISRTIREFGINAPSKTTFQLSNSGDTLDPADFIDGRVIIRLIANDGTNEEELAAWLFSIQRCENAFRVLTFTCVDYLSKYLEGDWPNTELVQGITPSDEDNWDSGICVPVTYGTAYVPLESIYSSGQRYYVLGPSGTYTISEVKSPDDWSSSSTWGSGSYTFTQSTIGSYRVFQPLIYDADNDGSADACGLFYSGSKFLPPLVEFYNSATQTTTNPAAVIKDILEDFGIDSSDFGTSWTSIQSTFTSLGLTFSGGFYKKKGRAELLSELLSMCHSVIDVQEKIEIRLISKTSQMSITKSLVKKGSNKIEGDFSYTPTKISNIDSGYVEWQSSGIPQTRLIKTLVPVDESSAGTTNNPDSNTFPAYLITDSQLAQAAGSLYFHRKHGVVGKIKTTTLPKTLILQPEDLVTFTHYDYGGLATGVVESITISRDLSITLDIASFGVARQDLGDFSFGPVTANAGQVDDHFPVGCRTFIASNPPDPQFVQVGDLWIDESDDNQLYRFEGQSIGWVTVRDGGIAQAVSDAADALAAVDGKITSFFQTSPPADSEATEGDLWFDTDDDNKVYRYDSTSGLSDPWVLARDSGIAEAIDAAATAQNTADGKIITFYQDGEPADSESSEGDLWVDTNDKNKLYRYTSGSWTLVRDTDIAQAIDDAAAAQATADGKIVTFYQNDPPADSESSEGDLWLDTNDGNKLYRYTSGSWSEVRDAGIAQAINDAQDAQQTADGKIVTFFQDDEPADSESSDGDLWIDTNDKNKLYRYQVDTWVNARDTDIAQAIYDAAAAQDTADSKVVTFYQTTAPADSESADGDLWIDSNDGNKLYRYNSGVWTAVQDTDISDALDDAATALALADGKITTFYRDTAPADSESSAGDLWFDTDDNDKLYTYLESAGWTAITNLAGTFPTNDNLIGYWDLNEGEGETAYDKSGYGNNGTLEGTSPQWSYGVAGKCFSTPGTDERVNVGNNTPLDLIGSDASGGYLDVTIAFWMKGASTQSMDARVMSKYQDTNNRVEISCVGVDSSAYLKVVLRKAGSQSYKDFTDILPFDDKWHFIVVIIDYTNTVIKLYMDAIESALQGTIGLVSGWDNTGDLLFGTRGDGLYPYDGMIDEVRIYNRALSASEVAALYANPTGNISTTPWQIIVGRFPFDDELLGYWDMDDGSGSIAYDKSGNENHGILSGSAPTWATGISGKSYSSTASNDRIAFGDSSLLDAMGDLSSGGIPDVGFSFWMKAITPLTTYHSLLTKYDGGDYFTLRSNSTTNQLQLYLVKGAVTVYAIFTDATPFDGEWHHIVLNLDLTNDIGKVFVDNVESTITADLSTLTSGWNNEGNFAIGGTAAGALSFNGLIDEVRIYNRTLTAQEIRSFFYYPSGNQSAIPWQTTIGNLPQDNDLLGYWDMDEGTGNVAFDKSGYDNHGTLEGTSPAWATGAAGKCFSSPGANERVDVGNSAPLSLIGDDSSGGYPDVSFSFWMNGDSTPNNSGRLLSKYVDANNDFYISSNGISNELAVGIKKSGTSVSQSFTDINPFSDSLHHIAVVVDYSNDVVRVYMDGVESRVTADLSSLGAGWDNTGNLAFGASSGGSVPYDGQIDEVRIYNRVLTINEIRALYFYPSGNQSNIVGASQLDGPYLTVGPNTSRGEYATLSAAIADLSTFGASGIFIKDGTYDEDDNISLPAANIDILGQSQHGVIIRTPTSLDSANYGFIEAPLSRTTTAYKYTFKNLTITTRWTETNAYIFFNYNAENITVSFTDVTFHMYDSTGSDHDCAIYYKTVWPGDGELFVDHCTFNNGSYGIAGINGRPGSYTPSKVRIYRNNFNNQYQHIHLYGGAAGILSIEENKFYNARSRGIYSTATDVMISGNKFEMDDSCTLEDASCFGIYLWCQSSDASTQINNNTFRMEDITVPSSVSSMSVLYFDNTSSTCSNNAIYFQTSDNLGLFCIVVGSSAYGAVVSNNSIKFDVNNPSGPSAQRGISVDADKCNIIGNNINGVNNYTYSYGLNTTSTADYVIFQSNTTLNVGSQWSDGGTNTQDYDNLDY